MHYKKVAAVILSAAISLQSVVPAFAAETAETGITAPGIENTAPEEEPEQVTGQAQETEDPPQETEEETGEETAGGAEDAAEDSTSEKAKDEEQAGAEESPEQETGPAQEEAQGPAEEVKETEEDLSGIEVVLDDSISAEDIDMPPEEDMLSDYIDSVMYPSPSGMRQKMYSVYAGSNLRGMNAALYTAMRQRIALVASGELSNTRFELKIDDLDLEKRSWTAEELGVDSIVVNGKIPSTVTQAVMREIEFDFDSLIGALLEDEPYALYWFDKTGNISMSGFSLATKYNSAGELEIGVKGSVTICFPVASEYAVSTYETDTSYGQSITHAREKAAEIVAENENLTDYEKLVAYKDTICGLTAYNWNAAYEDIDYGNPWQLIWVFDEDPGTRVVCEGYSKAFKYLCDLSTFRSENTGCILATGTMTSNGSSGLHMWNVVKTAGGENYIVDVTNCDSGSVGYSDKLFMVGPDEGSEEDIYNGYTVNFSGNHVEYEYMFPDMFELFSEEDITIAPGKYAGQAETDIAEADINLSEESFIYNGDALVPEVEVIYNGTFLEEGTDYTMTVLSDDVISAGEKAIMIEGRGSYGGAITVFYDILRRDIGSADIAVAENEYRYEGTPVMPVPEISFNGNTLEEGVDYTLSYKDNEGAGTGMIIISGAGNFEGKAVVEFTIVGDVKRGFTEENGRTVYYDDNGEKHTGILITEDGTYYFNADGFMLKLRWVTENGGTYFFGSDGRAYKGMCRISGKPFYFNEEGHRTLGLVSVNQNIYYMTASGMLMNEWKDIGTRRYYFGEDGRAAAGITEIDGDTYCFNDGGVMLKLRWVTENGGTYFFGSDGRAYKGMCRISGKPFYFNEEGHRTLGLVSVNQNIYYMTASGMLMNEWKDIGAKRYHFGETGAASLGLVTIDGDIYFFSNDGTMVRGRWVTENGGIYFFGKDGKAYRGTCVINGKTFRFDENGKMMR